MRSEKEFVLFEWFPLSQSFGCTTVQTRESMLFSSLIFSHVIKILYFYVCLG